VCDLPVVLLSNRGMRAKKRWILLILLRYLYFTFLFELYSVCIITLFLTVKIMYVEAFPIVYLLLPGMRGNLLPGLATALPPTPSAKSN
jgi:hypothetical protein